MEKPLSNLADNQLQQLLKRRRQDAFEIIFEKYWKRLFSYAYRIYADEEICQDIVQEVFISLWEKAETSNILNLEAYLLRAVKYKVANHIRDLKFSETHINILQNIPSPLQMDNMEYQELEKKVLEEIMKLPPKSREVFMLSRFQNFTNTEISEKLNISIRTVETHISIALKHLRAHLDIIQLSCVIMGLFLQS